MAKEVTDREAAAEAVAAAAETHAPQIAEAFAAKFKAFAPKKQPLPDIGALLHIVAAALRAQAADLQQKSAAHDAELADDAAPRQARDNATAELTQTLVAIRATTETVYGRAGLQALGIDGRTPTDSKAIQEHARNFLARIKDPKLKLPKPQEGVVIDKAVWIAKVEKTLPVLTQARKDVAREEREAEATINAKNKAMESFDDLFGVVATFTSSMLDLIGEEDLASRIKPSVRRRGVTAETDTEDAASPTENAAPAKDAPPSPQ
ncbi:MAG: hypothetical protein IPK82_38480 [Polyangiaceae bacterium]|nr:hypothetical protein [Polyangiaceae bacterium]